MTASGVRKEHKVVTVLFTDGVGVTARAESVADMGEALLAASA